MALLSRLFTVSAQALTFLAASVLFVLMVTVVVDVVGRYFFSAPLSGGYEIVQLGMGVLTFAALPLVTLRRQHITVDILAANLTGPVLWLQNITVQLASIGVLGLMSWRLWEQGSSLARWGETTATLGIPMAPLAYVLALLAAFSAVMCVPLLFSSLIEDDSTDKKRLLSASEGVK